MADDPYEAPGNSSGPKEQAAGAAQDAAEQVKASVQDAADQAKAKAADASQQARGRVQQQVDQRSTQAGEQVSGTAQDLRSIGEHLRDQGNTQPADLADQIADRAERAGQYLQDADADRLLADVEEFGRRRPWAVIGGGLLVGFGAARFLKASSEQRSARTGSAPVPPAGAGYIPSSLAAAPYAPPTATATQPVGVATSGSGGADEAHGVTVSDASSAGVEPGIHQRREEGLAADERA